MFKLEDGRTELFQWDLNRRVIVEDKAVTEVHFCNRTDNCSLCTPVYEENGVRLAEIPNILLQSDLTIRAYAYDRFYTKQQATFKVNKRTKPADYAYSETEIVTWQSIREDYDELEGRVSALEEGGTGGGGSGEPGEDGGYYIPSVDANGNLTWTGSKEGMVAVAGANIKGEPGKDGQPGKDGAPGKDGENYVLTEADKQEIAALALTLLPDAEEVSY